MTMTSVTRTMTAAALGAAAMYWLDPAAGRRRRTLLRERLEHTATQLGDAVGIGGQDLWHRARGVDARMRSVLTPDEPSDEVLSERVRSALGRAVCTPVQSMLRPYRAK